MPFIKAKDGAQLFYKDWGPTDAQPIASAEIIQPRHSGEKIEPAT